jgi:c-di-GMP-binding flagellar brake protein YcgR
MEERRKLSRKHTEEYFRQRRRRRRDFFAVLDDRSGELLGHLVDITAEGMMIISGEPIDTGLMYDVRIELPETVDGRESITFYARPVWSGKAPEEGFHHTGFQFLKAPPADVKVIALLFGDEIEKS